MIFLLALYAIAAVLTMLRVISLHGYAPHVFAMAVGCGFFWFFFLPLEIYQVWDERRQERIYEEWLSRMAERGAWDEDTK